MFDVNPTKHRGTERYAKIYGALVTRAVAGACLTTYGELAAIAGLPPTGNYMAQTIGEILGEIMCIETAQGRPPLPALVVRADSSMPGKGFFVAASHLRLIHDDATDEERKLFWEGCVQAIHETWCGDLADSRYPEQSTPVKALLEIYRCIEIDGKFDDKDLVAKALVYSGVRRESFEYAHPAQNRNTA